MTAPPPDVSIRPERPYDAAAISRLHDEAFGGLTEGRIVDDLRGTDDWLPDGSLVAEDRGRRIVGHLLLSLAQLMGEAGEVVSSIGVIGPVAVHPERQGQGIGAALMRAGISAAAARGLPLICLLGHADYYPRFGFEPARAIGIQAPHPWPDANWLALRLPAWTPQLRGRVRFPPAFPDE